MTELDSGKQLYRGILPKAIQYRESFVFPFEAKYLGQPLIDETHWYQDYWLIGSIAACLTYLAVILSIQHFMTHRKPVHMDGLLFIWNVANAIVSILGTARCAPEFFNAISQGFETSICYSVSIHTVAAFWHKIFGISKLIELGDTVFLVLRKRPLTLLHVYHHTSVLVATWMAGAEHNGAARWYIFMNYAVHAVMYTYFALKIYGAHISKIGSMCLTLTQITQFVVGLTISYVVYVAKIEGKQCQHSWKNWCTLMVMYFSYFVLFLRFFVNAYLTKSKKSQRKVQ